VSVEEAFAKLVGRQPSEPERQRLYRLRDGLGLRDNDAFWSIVMALEHYDSFFRAYPEKLAEETSRSIESARAAFAVAAQSEVAQVQRVLCAKVAETSVEIARKLAERPVRVHQVTVAMAAVVAFGALCLRAGYSLGTSDRPFWAERVDGLRPSTRMLAMVLSVPAGWMIFALLVPVAVYGARAGWAIARDAVANMSDKAVGWSLVVISVVGCAACAVMLAEVT